MVALLDFPHFAATSSLLPRCCQHCCCWVMVLSPLRRSRHERIHFPQFKVQSQMNKSQDAAHFNAVEFSNGTLPNTAGTISATRDPNQTCLMAGYNMMDLSNNKKTKIIAPATTSCCNKIPTARTTAALFSLQRVSLHAWTLGKYETEISVFIKHTQLPFSIFVFGSLKIIVLFLLTKLIS